MIDVKTSICKQLEITQIARLDEQYFVNPWDEKQWTYEVNENPVSKVLVLKDDEDVIAYIDYWITFDSATIAKICVKDQYRRKHLGSQMLDEMMRDLKQQEVLYVTLEVRVSNLPAINLYKKYGFNEITVKSKYYSDGEDALYMVKEVQ